MLMPDLPEWQPLDGASPAAPSAGHVVAVVASDGAIAGGWGAYAAVDLARRWAEEGARVMLVDSAMGAPSLHEPTGVPNREGLSDAALFGASLERVSLTPDGERFLFVPAGTPVAEPGSVARDPRWHRIVGGVAEAGATMMLYLREDEDYTPAFLGSVSDIVVLANPDEALPNVLRDLEPLVRAVTGPGEGGLRPAASAASSPAAPSTGGDAQGGLSRTILLVLLAIVVAAALGLFLSSGVG